MRLNTLRHPVTGRSWIMTFGGYVMWSFAQQFLLQSYFLYRFRHVERGMGMIFKAVGLPPRGRLSDLSAKAAWRLMQWRRQRFAMRLAA